MLRPYSPTSKFCHEPGISHIRKASRLNWPRERTNMWHWKLLTVEDHEPVNTPPVLTETLLKTDLNTSVHFLQSSKWQLSNTFPRNNYVHILYLSQPSYMTSPLIVL
jgi:hypothetical protein